jgi:hypothetical protein
MTCGNDLPIWHRWQFNKHKVQQKTSIFYCGNFLVQIPTRYQWHFFASCINFSLNPFPFLISRTWCYDTHINHWTTGFTTEWSQRTYIWIPTSKKSLSLFRLASDTFCQFGTMYRQTKINFCLLSVFFLKEENFSKLCLDIKFSSTNDPAFSSQPQRPLFRGQR